MKKTPIWVLLILMSGHAPAQKLYKYQDKQGTWHFTDKPPEAGEKAAVRQLKVAPRQRVWLNREGEEQHPKYTLRNDYAGPVEVEVDLSKANNARSTPALPNRFVVPPGLSDPLLEMGALNESESWSFTLSYRYVIGQPLAHYRSNETYYPPFETGASFQITQAFGGAFSHQDDQNKYAVDIAMPEGTPVHAARAGLVMEVEDDYFEGGAHQSYRNKANSIRILHDDGSMAVYAHMELEKAQVQPGDAVAAGQLIGYSGNTGYSTGPHLHFAVQYNQGMKLVSAPFTFRTPLGQAEEPAAGAWLTGLTPHD